MSNLLEERFEWAFKPVNSEQYKEAEWNLKVLGVVMNAAWNREDYETYKQCQERRTVLGEPIAEAANESHRRVMLVVDEFRNSEWSRYGRC